MRQKRKVVILGGGFAGLEAVRRLKQADVDVVLVDRKNHHTFQPLLYQVATAGLEPEAVANSFRSIFNRQKNFDFCLATVEEILPHQKKIRTDQGLIDYDSLIIATGGKPNFFKMDDVLRESLPLKVIAHAVNIREVIFKKMEHALWAKKKGRQPSLDIAIVGGGPTGVEMAGALAEIRNHILTKDYPQLSISKMKIYLVDMNERLLPAMSESSSEYAEQYLREEKIDVMLGQQVASYDGKKIMFKDDKPAIETDLMIWTAGIQGNAPAGLREESYQKGQLAVDAYHRVRGYENIYALGDVALLKCESYPKGHPMLAPVAQQQARNLAKNLMREIDGKPPQSFRYHNLGLMATLGRNHGVVELNGFRFKGRIAWYVWLFVHLMALVGFRNKAVALVNWFWNYFFFDRSLRLVFNEK